MPPQVVFGRPGVVLPSGRYARLRAVDATTIAFECTYDAQLVYEMKERIPAASRRWDGANKRWLIDPAYAASCADVAEIYLGIRPEVPAVPSTGVPALEQRLVRLEYLGRCKVRDFDSLEGTATGFADGAWSLSFATKVLRAWFEPTDELDEQPTAKRSKPSTLYAVLSVKQKATPDELRAAYRRLARATHPDVNKEEGAAEQFIQIKRAYDVLSDEGKRARYDAGLEWERDERRRELARERYQERKEAAERAEYRSPLTCGWVFVEGRSKLGMFHVETILQWEDITDERGRVMVSSWPAGGNQFEVFWVEP